MSREMAKCLYIIRAIVEGMGGTVSVDIADSVINIDISDDKAAECAARVEEAMYDIGSEEAT
ncbi:MAG TPA: hypothetical protein EYP19_15060 [Desulfobacterales bacterium]|nr:hypothetical protein [Desulfobacterales bacterium]